MYDFGLSEYLWLGILPESLDERERILRMAGQYRAMNGDI
jgi:hypothetical protein